MKNKRIFSEEEVNYIINNWGKISAHSMKNKLNCTWYAVCKVASSHGLNAPKSNKWTTEDEETLKILAENYHYKNIAVIMNKSSNAIYLKARKLGITLIQDRRSWKPDEEKLFAELWGTTSIEKIAESMKRTVFSLKVKAVRMGLGPMIKNNYEVLTVSDISELLNISRDRITTTWVNLGLKLQKKKLTDNTSYYVISLDNLVLFLKNNQNEWDSRNVERYMLGSEPTWLKEKRKRDLKENPLWYRKWSEEEINKAEYLLKIGKNYSEIAIILNRSEGAVAEVLRKLGHSYELKQFWKGKEIKYLRENYEEKTYSEIAEYLNRSEGAVTAKASELNYQKKLTK